MENIGMEKSPQLNRDSSVSLFKGPTPSLLELTGQHEGPCVSIYLSTHRNFPDNQKDSIVFKNLLRTVEESLKEKFSHNEITLIMDKLNTLKDNSDFWNHSLDGLGVFASPQLFKVMTLQRSVPELSIVSNSFHIKPLLRIFQTTDRYQVLNLNGRDVKLYEGNRDVIDEVQLSAEVPKNISEVLGEAMDHTNPDTEEFFREVDRAILEHHSRPSGLPLFLAALPENQAQFQRISHNPFLMNEGINLNADTLSNQELREKVWKLVKPFYDSHLESLIESYGEAESKKLGSDDLNEVTKAALEGKISTLFIEANRLIPGHINYKTASIEHDQLQNPEVDDLLDDIGECVLNKGGNIIMTPPHMMPSSSGLAAIYRY